MMGIQWAFSHQAWLSERVHTGDSLCLQLSGWRLLARTSAHPIVGLHRLLLLLLLLLRLPAATIPAFPEQADLSGSCRLDLPNELFKGIARACPSSSSSSSGAPATVSRSRCCPTLAAWLYSAYSATALAAAVKLQTSATQSSDLPVLPDDSETCMDGVQKALRGHGVALGTSTAPATWPTATAACDCALSPAPAASAWREAATAGGSPATTTPAASRRTAPPAAQREEKEDGASHGGGGSAAGGGNSEVLSVRGGKLGRSRDCQLMALTWLLGRNRTLYMPTVTRVLRTLMMTPANGRPLSCSLSRDGIPLAVNYVQLDETTRIRTQTTANGPD
ncbi:unnamed protein product [Spirodela intermedia]|uniref:Uncharacterized protein n=1 Tax=Spirodela intermedia TaxID=51605 RepID=A0A7I8J608_SPIIN|nr:unnamed protein product [Spirodela intermedia]CAA6665474.1 unnamed protein product [Spirodela intermedia]